MSDALQRSFERFDRDRLKGISFDAGKDFDVVAISFDARENDKDGFSQKQKSELYGAIRASRNRKRAGIF
jgi:hypothetical protein